MQGTSRQKVKSQGYCILYIKFLVELDGTKNVNVAMIKIIN